MKKQILLLTALCIFAFIANAKICMVSSNQNSQGQYSDPKTPIVETPKEDIAFVNKSIGVFTYLQQLLYYKTNAHFEQPSPLFCEILFACK